MIKVGGRMWDPMPATGPGPSCQREADELSMGRVLMTQREVESTGHENGQDISGSLSLLGSTDLEKGRSGGVARYPEIPTVTALHSSVTNLTQTG